MREMSLTEQRYKAVLAVIANGRTVSEVASEWGVCRQTMHRWLARYEGDGLEGLGNRSSRPAHCPHQTPPEVEAVVLEMRRAHPYWAARRIAFELARKRSPAVALRVSRLSLSGSVRGHRPQQPTPAAGALEALGARGTHGALAAGRRPWLRALRRHGREGADGHRRPLQVLRLSSSHGSGTDSGGLRRLQFSAARIWSTGAGPDGQRHGVHWALCSAAGRSAVRPHLPGERH